jgi:hypothetical protein
MTVARTRPFLQANEPPRPFGEVLGERRRMDPEARERDRVMAKIAELEGCAADAVDAAERKRLFCEAEGWRSALHGLQPTR